MRPLGFVRSEQYRLRKRAVRDGETRLRLDLAEEAIIVDPFHRSKRYERPDGSIADLNEKRLLMVFEVVGNTIVFIDFVEL